MKRSSLLLSWALSASVPVLAENWPGFRGPEHQGVSKEKGVPTEWSPTRNVAWKTAIPGESWSSPIVWRNRVFLTTATESGASCHVLALDRKSGAILWDREVFQQVTRKKEARNTYATPTPVTDGRRVYVAFGDGSFAALEFSGQVVWTNRSLPFYGQHGLGSSPVLVDGILVMARDGSSDGEDKLVGWQKPWDRSYVVALDAKTGRELWKTGRGQSRISHGTPTVAQVDGRNVVVSEAGDVVQGFDLKTGKLLWTDAVTGEGKVPSPIVAAGYVFTSGGWGGRDSTKAFPLHAAGGLSTNRMVWEQKRGTPKVPSMIVVPPHLFSVTDTGLATCLQVGSGEVVWQDRLGGNFSASPVAADGRLYFVGDNGETAVVQAGPEFRVLARNPLGEKVQASPAISQGQIFIRTEKSLFCIGGR